MMKMTVLLFLSFSSVVLGASADEDGDEQVLAVANNCTCICTPSTVTPNNTFEDIVCPCVQRENVRIRLIGGSQNYFADSDFWNEVTRGFQKAALQTRIQAEVRYTTQAEDTTMTAQEWFRQQIRTAIAEQLDGVVISPSLQVSQMSDILKEIHSSGSTMKYITFGPGLHTIDQYSSDIRPPLHIGGNSSESGELAAKHVVQSGKGSYAICLNHKRSTVDYNATCQAFVNYINSQGGYAEYVSYDIWTQSYSDWKDLLSQKRSKITAIFVLSATIAEQTLSVLTNNQIGTSNRIMIGTMHFSPSMWNRLGKDLDFLISHQPFLQGTFSAYLMLQYVTRTNLALRFDTGPILLTQMPTMPKRKTTSPYPVIEFIAHQQFDPFWQVIHKFVREAANDTQTIDPLTLLTETGYQENVPTDQARLINKYCRTSDGVMTSIPDTVKVPKAISDCIQNGTQVISINSGSDVAKQLGTLDHVGQIEDNAGRRAGEELVKLGMTVAMCITNEGAPTIRCDAFHKYVIDAGLEYIYKNPNQKNVTFFKVSSSDATTTVDLVTSWLQQNLADPTQPKIDGILMLGTESPLVAKAIKAVGRRGKVRLCSFDLTEEIFDDIAKGDIHLTIDQQQIMQGYLPVAMFESYFLNGNLTTTFPMQTGPFFVNHENYLGKYCQFAPQCSLSVTYYGPDLILTDGSKIYDAPVALFSTYNKSSPPYQLTGQLVDVGTGCDLSTTSGVYSTKILLMSEGGCFFYNKARLASEAKAFAVIIGRTLQGYPAINMTAGLGQYVSIPVLSVNYDSYVKLLAQNGEKIIIDSSEYAPPSHLLSWKHVSKGAYIALATIAGLMQVMLIPMVILVWCYRSSPSIRSASPTFLVIIGFGCFVVLFSVYFFGIDADLFDVSKLSSFCTLQSWFVGVGFIIIVGSLIAKSWRIHRIFHSLATQKSVSISDRELMKMLALLMTGEIVILSVWTGIGPYEATLTVDATTQYYSCSTSCTGCAAAWISYKGLLVAIALYLAFTTRNVHSQFRESQIILFSMYTIIIFTGIAIVLILVMTNNPEALFLIESLLVIIFVCSFTCIQYASKLYFALTTVASDCHASVPVTKSQFSVHTPPEKEST